MKTSPFFAALLILTLLMLCVHGSTARASDRAMRATSMGVSVLEPDSVKASYGEEGMQRSLDSLSVVDLGCLDAFRVIVVENFDASEVGVDYSGIQSAIMEVIAAGHIPVFSFLDAEVPDSLDLGEIYVTYDFQSFHTRPYYRYSVQLQIMAGAVLFHSGRYASAEIWREESEETSANSIFAIRDTARELARLVVYDFHLANTVFTRRCE